MSCGWKVEIFYFRCDMIEIEIQQPAAADNEIQFDEDF